MKKKIKKTKFNTPTKPACGNTVLAADLIGRKVKLVVDCDDEYKGVEFEVVREGLFNAPSVDMQGNRTMYCDVNVGRLQICG